MEIKRFLSRWFGRVRLARRRSPAWVRPDNAITRQVRADSLAQWDALFPRRRRRPARIEDFPDLAQAVLDLESGRLQTRTAEPAPVEERQVPPGHAERHGPRPGTRSARRRRHHAA